MATQRLTLASVAGDAGAAAAERFRVWRKVQPEAEAVDRFCLRLRAGGTQLPVVYFCEWVDRWLMGDLVPGPAAVAGGRYEAACLTPQETVAWAGQCGSQFPEQLWLAARLREAAEALEWLAGGAVLVVREVLGPSTTDDEVREALHGVPAWLADE